jgi:hypothetical protein
MYSSGWTPYVILIHISSSSRLRFLLLFVDPAAGSSSCPALRRLRSWLRHHPPLPPSCQPQPLLPPRAPTPTPDATRPPLPLLLMLSVVWPSTGWGTTGVVADDDGCRCGARPSGPCCQWRTSSITTTSSAASIVDSAPP